MQRIASPLLLALFASTGFGAPSDPAPPRPRVEQTRDRSRQIIVSGAEASLRGRFMSAAGELRTLTLKTLQQSSASYPQARPILLVLDSTLPPARSPHVEVIEDPAGLKLQVTLPSQLDPASRIFERTIVKALLLELGLRKQQTLPEVLPEPPRWLVDALVHCIQTAEAFLPVHSVQPLLNSGKVPPLIPLLCRLDSDPIPSSQAEENIARCVLSLLMEQADASSGIVRLLLGSSEKTAVVGAVLKNFPQLGSSEADLERQWTLKLANLGTQADRVVMTGDRTLLELNRLLELEGVDGRGAHFKFALDRFSDYMRRPGLEGILKARHLELVMLASRGHSFYRPALALYVEASAALAAGQTAGLAPKFKRAGELKEEARARLEAISDYLNWYEIEKAPYQRPAWISEMYRIWSQTWPPPKHPEVTKRLDEWEKRLQQQSEDEEIKRALQEAGARSQKKAQEGPAKKNGTP